MKKFTLLLIMILTVLTMSAQKVNDKGQVVQKCLDLQELQKYYPQSAIEQNEPVYILLHGVSFESDMRISKFGKEPEYVKKEDLMDGRIQGFFLFHTIEVDAKEAHVSFAYYYDNRGNDSPLNGSHVKFEVFLSKDAKGQWNISKTNSDRR